MHTRSLACLLFLGMAAVSPASPNKVALDRLETQLNRVAKPFNGRLGYHLRLLKTGESIGYREDERFPSASTIKSCVALAALQMVDEGKLKMSDKQKIPTEPGRREASMWSFFMKDGLSLDLDAWVNLMVTVSDNTATIVTRDWIGTMEVNRRLEALGLMNTKILGNPPRDNLSMTRLRRQFGMGMTTPREMATFLEMLYRNKAGSAAVCEKLIRIKSHQYWDDWIGSSVPVDVKVASKSGAISRSRSDIAIVFSPTQPYVLTIYTDHQKDRRWAGDNEGDLALRRMSSLVWNGLHPNRPYALPKGYEEKFLPTGGGVE